MQSGGGVQSGRGVELGHDVGPEHGVGSRYGAQEPLSFLAVQKMATMTTLSS